MSDDKVTSVVSVKINENNEIEFMHIEEKSNDYDNTIEVNDNDDVDDDNDDDEREIDGDSILVQKGNGVMSIKVKKQTVIEHICAKCSSSFTSVLALKKHLNLCKNVPINQAEIFQTRDIKQIIELPNALSKDVMNKKVCFCCLEIMSAAHIGHIRCNFCPKQFKSHLNLERHLFTLHSASTEFPCKQCNATCPTNQILELHVETHAQTTKPFSCKNCSKEFTRKYHLDRHLQFTGCDKRHPKLLLPCDVCNKVFTRTDNLREHLRSHMGQATKRKDYQCVYCDKSFYGSSLLNIHMRTHTGERPFPCDLCHKAFPSNGALRKHRRMHTGERPYSCQICQKCFAAKETLNRHVKIHTGERPHKCKLCNKSFIQATQLKAHQYQHSRENGFTCDLCNMIFVRKMHLKMHFQSIHMKQEQVRQQQQQQQQQLHQQQQQQLHQQEHLQQQQEQKPQLLQKQFKLTEMSKKISVPVPTTSKMLIKTEPSARTKKPKIINFSKTNRSSNEVVIEYIDQSAQSQQSDKSKVHYCDICHKIFRQTKRFHNHMRDKHLVEVTPSPSDPIETNELNETQKSYIDVVIKKEDELDIFEPKSIEMNEQHLRDNIGKVLKKLIDEDMLIPFGWPNKSVDYVLVALITEFGLKPVDIDTCPDQATVLRENTKLLFSSVIENYSIKNMLNNCTIDEIILQVLHE